MSLYLLYFLKTWNFFCNIWILKIILALELFPLACLYYGWQRWPWIETWKTGPTLQVLMLSTPAKITKRKWISIVSDMPFHSCFSGRIPKKNLKPGSNVAEFNATEENTYCSHSFVSDSAHVKYIYHVWTGRKSICAPEKLCICPYRHPSRVFLSWFSGRPQEDLEVPFILRKPVLGWRVTLLAESLNLSERLYERKSRTPLPK